MKKTLYLMSSGRLRRKQNTLVLEIPSPDREAIEQRKYFPIEQVGEIHAFGELDLNKRLLEFLSKNEILLHVYNRRG